MLQRNKKLLAQADDLPIIQSMLHCNMIQAKAGFRRRHFFTSPLLEIFIC